MKQNPASLLTCFFSECESALRFLEIKHGYSYLSGLVDYQKGRQVITPYHGKEIDGTFHAITRYELENHAIEIFYGDAEFIIEAYIYPNRVDRILLPDILQAARKNNPSLKNTSWIVNKDNIKQVVCNIANSIRNNKQHILYSNARVIERALTMRSILNKQRIYEQYKRDIQNASEQAAKAFLKNNYQRVIEILSPYENDLSKADKKKLAIARKNLFSPT